MVNSKITAIVIAKDEESMIGDCLKSLSFADQIIVVNHKSTDNTVKIAKKYATEIIDFDGIGFDEARNFGLKFAKNNWIFYLDADERVTPELKNNLIALAKISSQYSAFKIARQNILLGKNMKYGGWGNDYVIRLFKKSNLIGYVNHLHEQPKFNGNLGLILTPILHYSHRDLYSMIEKTIIYTNVEAQNRLDAQHPPIREWRILRVMLTEFWLRFVKLSAWRDGAEGIIDGLFQVFNSFIIYSRLWELQYESKNLNS